MPTYPSTLPRPLLEGYKLSPVSPVARTDMEFGAARVRRRTHARNDQIDASWTFTAAELATFRAWFDDDTMGISGGASWFSMVIDTGDNVSTVKDVRFVKMWTADRIAGTIFWKLTAQVEVH